MRQQRKEDRRRGADAGRGDDARDEPAPILDGLANGFDSAVGGVVDGVTGLVQAPIRGVEEGGVVGGIVGVGAGVLGLVVKPVVGVADAATDVLRGIRDTTQAPEEAGEAPLPRSGSSRDLRGGDGEGDDAPARQRPSRALYGRFRHLRRFSHADARAAAALRAAAAAGEAYEPPDLDAFLARAPLDGNGTELVVARGGLAVFGPGAPRRHLFAPPDALLGCKLDAADPGSALLLLRPAPGDDEPQRYRVRFDGDAAGAALAAHVSDFVSERLQ